MNTLIQLEITSASVVRFRTGPDRCLLVTNKEGPYPEENLGLAFEAPRGMGPIYIRGMFGLEAEILEMKPSDRKFSKT